MRPPPVEPAQPPINERISSNTGKKWGHKEKSWVVNPVVVAIDTVWNIPWIKLSLGDSVWVINRVKHVITMAMPITLLKKRVSESRWYISRLRRCKAIKCSPKLMAEAAIKKVQIKRISSL